MVKASCLYLYLRPVLVGFAPDGLASAAFAVVAAAAVAHEAVQPVAAVVVRAESVVDALAVQVGS